MLLKKIPFTAAAHEFGKYKAKEELTADESINLFRAIRSYAQKYVSVPVHS